MLDNQELLESPNYLLTTYQLEIYKQLADYMERHNLKNKDIAEKLKVSDSYVSQVLNGNFNFTLKKLIQLGLMINKVPYLEFVELEEYWRREKEGTKEVVIKETHFHYAVDSSVPENESIVDYMQYDLLDLKGGSLPKSVTAYSS